jgi:hypothetical protein
VTMSASNPLAALCDGLARHLHEEPSDPYIMDLGCLISTASPVLLDLLHTANGTVTFTWHNDALFMLAGKHRKQLLP